MNEGNAVQAEVPTIAIQFDTLLTGLLAGYPRHAEFGAWFDALSQRDRHLLVVQGLHSQVCNGGWAQWIENGYQDREGAALGLALARLAPLCPLVPAVQVLVDRAAVIAGNDDGEAYLSEEARDLLDPLDDRYYAISDEFEAAFQAYFVVWE